MSVKSKVAKIHGMYILFTYLKSELNELNKGKPTIKT